MTICRYCFRSIELRVAGEIEDFDEYDDVTHDVACNSSVWADSTELFSWVCTGDDDHYWHAPGGAESLYEIERSLR